MASIFSKYQKCAKLNCKCKNGSLHGPYFWLVKYLKKTAEKKGHYKWQYLGKSPEAAYSKLSSINEKFAERFDVELIKSREEKAKQLALAKMRKDQKSITVKLEV